jgi:hypothetical protein
MRRDAPREPALDDAPVYIVGLARSGKTALRRRLGEHPRLSLTRKTRLWSRYDGRFGDLASDAALARCLDRIVADPDVRRLGPDRERLVAEFRQGPSSYAHLFALLHRHHAARCGKPRWGEQWGPGDRYAERIFAAFPAARMIHLVGSLGSADARPSSAVGAVRDVRDAVAGVGSSWRATRNRARFGADRYLVVCDDASPTDPDAALREVYAFIGERPADVVASSVASGGFR